MSRTTSLDTLQCARLSRRSFVTSSATLACSIAFPQATWAADGAKPLSDAASRKTANIWVTFQKNGLIEVTQPVVEMGTGAITALAMYVAEELDAEWNDMRLVMAPHNDKTYGNPLFFNWQIAAGVRTALGYYDALRLGGAQARHLLLTAAAKQWSVPITQLTTSNSVVSHSASGRQARYVDLIDKVVVPDRFPDFVDPDYQHQPTDLFFGKAPPSPVQPSKDKPDALKLKRRAEFKLIGVNTPRLDIPSKTYGKAKYGIDYSVDGMLYAMVQVAPQLNGAPDTVDAKAARAVQGIVDIVTLPYGVAIVGTNMFSVLTARDLVDITWRDGVSAHLTVLPPEKGAAHDAHPPAPAAMAYPKYDSTATLDDFARIARERHSATHVYTKGDAATAASLLSGKGPPSVTVMAFEAQSELAYHAPIEPQNAIVSVAQDKKSAEAWVGTQMPLVDAYVVSEVLGISMDQVKVNAIEPGGAFGRRAEAGAVVDAAHLSAKLGKPVKVIWNRQDDLRRNPHRMAMASRMEAAIDKEGNILATRHAIVADSWMARTQPDLYKSFGGSDPNNWSSSVHVYDVPHQVVDSFTERRAVDVCYLRGIAAPHAKFCQESLIDILALKSKKDPLDYRLGILKGEPRGQAVLREVAKMADWSRKRKGTALGIAYADYTNAHVAMVAEVSLDRKSGEIKVHDIWCAVDVGMPVLPDGILTQSEGGIIMALSIALKEKVTIKDSVTQESTFADYPIMKMSEVPNIEIKIVATDNPIAGAGELSMYPVAAAVNCAFARLSGKYVNRLPILPDTVLKIINS